MTEPDLLIFGLLGAATFALGFMTWILVNRICDALDEMRETQNAVAKNIVRLDEAVINILKTLGAYENDE